MCFGILPSSGTHITHCLKTASSNFVFGSNCGHFFVFFKQEAFVQFAIKILNFCQSAKIVQKTQKNTDQIQSISLLCHNNPIT
jgi:hypothetical protein